MELVVGVKVTTELDSDNKIIWLLDCPTPDIPLVIDDWIRVRWEVLIEEANMGRLSPPCDLLGVEDSKLFGVMVEEELVVTSVVVEDCLLKDCHEKFVDDISVLVAEYKEDVSSVDVPSKF